MTAVENVGVSIRIFLVDGTPQGLRLVERMGWTGLCLAFARADYAVARARLEVGRTGVYILQGPDTDGRREKRVYVGEADEVRARLDSHQREKDFWTHGFVLTTRDDSLNKAHVRYLEAAFLRLARDADVATLDNGTAPPLPGLSEPERADMESFLREALLLLPLVGVGAFDLMTARPRVPRPSPEPEASRPAFAADASPTPSVPTVTTPVPSTPTAATSVTLYYRSGLVNAEGRDDSRGFLVYEGAIGARESKVMQQGYAALKERLLAEGVLSFEGPDRLRLTRDWLFESPSAAGGVLSGTSVNGRIAWRDATGRTLKTIQSAAAAQDLTGYSDTLTVR